MTRQELKAKSLRQFEANKWSNVGVNAVFEGITGATSALYNIQNETEKEFSMLKLYGAGLAMAGIVFLTGPMTAGYSEYFLSVSRDKGTCFSKLFNGFKNYWKNVGAYMIQFLYVGLWTLCFIVPGIIKAIAYSMQFYILQDHPEMSGSDALEASEQLMDGHKGEYFGLMFSFIGWILLSALTLGILWILKVGPWIAITKANFYNELIKYKKEEVVEEIKEEF